MSEFKCAIHPWVTGEKCCAESQEVGADLTGVATALSDELKNPVTVLHEEPFNPAPLYHDPVYAFDIDFMFYMLLVLPTWLVYLVLRTRFPEEHPWHQLKTRFSLREWAKGSTKLNNTFSATFWILGIIWLVVLLHILRK